MSKQVKIIKGHRKDCIALDAVYGESRKWNHWDTPWFLNTYSPLTHEHRDAAGRRNAQGGTHRWLRVGCNDPSCPALAEFDVELVEVTIERALKDQA